jgi:ATP phosphoribosyltransferase
VGLNVHEEHKGEGTPPEVVMTLGFGRCDLRIAVPDGFAWEGPGSLNGLRIATSYPNILGRWLAEEGVTAEIVELRGAVEVAPRLKLAHAICDLVSTGATLEANGLTPVALVLRSEAVLIRSPKPIDPALAHLADSVIARFKGVTASQGAKYVMMNAPRAALPQISDILPGAGAPTVTPLAGNEDYVAVHAVCQESVFWETLEKLKAAGASAILVMNIEKMM